LYRRLAQTQKRDRRFDGGMNGCVDAARVPTGEAIIRLVVRIRSNSEVYERNALSFLSPHIYYLLFARNRYY